MPRRLPRWLILTAIIVVLALGGLSSLGVAAVRRPFPQVDGEIAVRMLSGSVEVVRDSYGVPQIYADEPQDLFAAQGFIHAQERFFEMDLRRHVTAGRLSELFGPSQVTTDAFIRTMGWRRVAEAELDLLSASTRRYLDAYASGVNAYLREQDPSAISLEYAVLGVQGLSYRPEDWTAVDSLAWLKAMAWDLGANRGQEIDQALTAAVVGDERAEQLWPDYPMHDFAPIVTEGAVQGGAFDPRGKPASGGSGGLSDDQLAQAVPALQTVEEALRGMPELLAARGVESEAGSNSWVIDGSRTATGKPILGNDPHLATSIPSIFAQVGLHCRVVSEKCPFDVSGFSFAGMPGVIIGKNSKISWGLTTSYVDVQDLYLEELRGNTVREEDLFVPVDVRTEKIGVRGEDQPRTLIIRTTRHGPLLSDVDNDLQDVSVERSAADGKSYGIALGWAALEPARSMDAVFDLNTAANFDQFRKAASLLGAPSQNLVYADVEGNIGYQLAGQVPLRGKGDGRSLSPGWDPSYDWTGMLPPERLPYSLNPDSGYIVAANQPIIGDGYPYRLGSDYSYGWRSEEIADRLRDATGVTVDQAEQLFYDDTNRFAADLVPLLLKVKVEDPWVADGQTSLVGWDYGTAADSAPAAYFNVVLTKIMALTFRDELPDRLWPASGDRWYAALSRLLEAPDDRWWDDLTTPEIERRDDILLAAMTQARKEITALVARDRDQWQWGKLHRVTLRHGALGTSGIPPLEAMFNRGDYPAHGGPGVVNAMSYDLSEPYQVRNAPTMRMLIDLADLDRSRWVNQSGTSGHAYHANYDDQTELWATNQMWDFVSSRGRVNAAATHRLLLSPGQ